MKVICISHENYSNIPIDSSLPRPEVGEEVTVIGEKVYKDILPCYILKEYKSPISFIDWLYDKRNFATYSNLDETELVNIKEEACG
jgi:hypothetical protein